MMIHSGGKVSWTRALGSRRLPQVKLVDNVFEAETCSVHLGFGRGRLDLRSNSFKNFGVGSWQRPKLLVQRIAPPALGCYFGRITRSCADDSPLETRARVDASFFFFPRKSILVGFS